MKKYFAVLLLTFSAFMSQSCADPAANKPKATVSEASPESTSAKPAGAETLVVSPENSKIEFVAAKVTRSHNGSFKQFTGSIDLIPNKLEDSRVTIDIMTDSVVTDDEGRYRFVTIRPGAYPWRNHPNAWRPAHIHFSLFGTGFLSRLITQMYFPGDPLMPIDPVLNSIPDERARQRLVSKFDLKVTQPEWALGFTFDIVLRGSNATPMETR